MLLIIKKKSPVTMNTSFIKNKTKGTNFNLLHYKLNFTKVNTLS